jgi:large subunit ribosomal protein L14
MVLMGTKLKVVDISGVKIVSCVKVLGSSYKYNAMLGDVLIVSVKRVKKRTRFIAEKSRRLRRYSKGTLHRVLLIQTSVPFRRAQGIYLKFNQNAVVLVSKKNVPLTKKVKGPVPLELCKRYLALGRVCEYIV